MIDADVRVDMVEIRVRNVKVLEITSRRDLARGRPRLLIVLTADPIVCAGSWVDTPVGIILLRGIYAVRAQYVVDAIFGSLICRCGLGAGARYCCCLSAWPSSLLAARAVRA